MRKVVRHFRLYLKPVKFVIWTDLKIMPRTYTEMMMMLDASRRARSIVQSVEQGESDPGTRERVTE